MPRHHEIAASSHWLELIIIGLCPLFLVVDSAVQGVAIGLLVALTIVTISLIVGLSRKLIAFELHTLFMLIVSSTVASILILIVAAHFYGLYLAMGIYLPLIAINGFIFNQMEEIHFRENLLISLKYEVIASAAIILVFAVFGLVRELLINASLFRSFDFALGIFNRETGFVFIHKFGGFSIFEKSAGVLLILAMLIALFNFLSSLIKTSETMS